MFIRNALVRIFIEVRVTLSGFEMVYEMILHCQSFSGHSWNLAWVNPNSDLS